MTSPPVDDSSAGEREDTSPDRETVDRTPTDNRAEDTIEPPTESTESTESAEPEPNVDNQRPPAASEASDEVVEPQPIPTATRDTSAESEPQPAVDSNWWYWVAAVPIYVVGGIVAGAVAAMLFVFGVAVDVAGGMGLATAIVVALVVLGGVGYALVGVALSIMFPVGIYLDAKAVAAADVSWKPDAVLYLLVGAGSVVLSAFTLSAVVALYYLYRRNQAVGVP